VARPPAPADGPAPWYADGLQFTCTRCGNCCTGGAGFTWISAAEIAALAQHLGLDEEACRRRYTRTVHLQDGRTLISLVERANGDCVFWRKAGGCQVYDHRPRQCRTWPFWTRVVATPDTWETERAGCPGMGQGRRHDAATIARTAERDGLP
jgi:Fe-S-cluster containining protein